MRSTDRQIQFSLFYQITKIMHPIVTKASTFIGRTSGRIYLLSAVLIFAAANSVTRRLTEIGSQHLIDGRNPISLCNVLFVGNLCALLVLIPIYGRQLNFDSLKQLSRKDWLSLTAVAILSGAIAPGLIFTALSLTMVNNVVLVGRIEPPLILALSVWFLREKVNIWAVAGAFVCLGGVAVTLFLQSLGQNAPDSGFFIHIGTGELLTAGGALAASVGNLISKVKLANIPLGIFTIFRMAVGTVVFFFIALYLYGSEHFMDVFTPFLWQWMLIYSAVIVVIGQLAWFMGLKKSTASEISLASSFTPIAGILAAYFILGEAPNLAQYIGGSIIIGGIIISQIGVWRQSAAVPLSYKKEIDMEIGFKGI
ncbi:DMT family transporter [Argonema galeatum]|uniref:DMT family transporter n=1 Tax=Argonema galeatum TaxID=2942762 RepID=UPI0020122352|nr:DMT family transporter [Argonema galeatum]MCL1468113.1 DMT family transporter [Argonema galeatum A003/A1]